MEERPASATNAVEAVTHVLREVLNVDEVSPDDDFFELGGHSMLILRLVSVLRTTHDLNLPVRQFGVDARVSALAAACRPVRSAGNGGAR